MPTDPVNRTGIFGGTFDPVHNGHLEVARSFLNSGEIDELWVMPAPDPPLRNDGNLTDFSHRLKMVKAAFGGMNNVQISDFEQQISGKSYTWRTLEKLEKSYLKIRFLLCIGEDNLEKFSSWNQYQKILEKYRLLVAVRPGSDTSGIADEIRKQAVFVEHQPVDISATEIREKLDRGVMPDSLPKPVTEYIREHKLYGFPHG